MVTRLLLLAALLPGCPTADEGPPAPPGGDDTAPAAEVPGASCPEGTDLPLPKERPRTVVLMTVDTVNVDFLSGNHPEWDVTPRLRSFFAEGALFPHTLTTRGLSEPALASYLTGAYPRTHGIRVNDDETTIAADVATLFQRFQAAGYHTAGFSANMCQLIDANVEERLCTETTEDNGLTQQQADAALVVAVDSLLSQVDPEEPWFIWVHFLDPHDPFSAREPWFSTFHPDRYDGPYVALSETQIEDVTMGRTALTAEDRRYLEAVYASQVAEADQNAGLVLDSLDAWSRGDAVVAFGFDHGEELARRGTYFYHGCSPYNLVTGVTSAIRAPGRVAPGEVLDHWISTTDIAPTVVELAGLEWDGPAEGRSLLDNLRRCVEPRHDVYMERGYLTAAVVRDNWKFILDPGLGDPTCRYNQSEYAYPGVERELFDLGSDPDELQDLAPLAPGEAATMEAAVCDWVLAKTWESAERDGENELVQLCRAGR